MNPHQLLRKLHYSLLNVDQVDLNKSWNYKNVVSPFYRLYLIRGGGGRLSTSSETVRLEAGYLYLIPCFTPCNYACDKYLSQSYLHFTEESIDGTSLFVWNRKIFKVKAGAADRSNFERLLALNPGRGLVKSADPKDYERQPILRAFQELNNNLSPSAYVETHGIILILLSRFLSDETFQLEKRTILPPRISDAVQYIQANLQAPITVGDLAARANLNADYFSRIFTQHIGVRPLTYIQLRRVERAQWLIATTDLSFTEIADQTGFETLAYFSRIFKQRSGQTPSEYRAQSWEV